MDLALVTVLANVPYHVPGAFVEVQADRFELAVLASHAHAVENYDLTLFCQLFAYQCDERHHITFVIRASLSAAS